jgi:hypothetical protein
MQPTSELEAVNVLLDAIGSAPINTLVPPIGVDALKAQNKLNWVSRVVQGEGWQFNSERDYPIARNDDDEIVVPQNTLRVGVHRLVGDVAQRGLRLYDRAKHSFQFSADIKVNLVLLLPFEELPEFARLYITIRAAREFQKTTEGVMDERFSELQELRARADMARHDGKNGNLNVLNGMGTFRPGDALRR